MLRLSPAPYRAHPRLAVVLAYYNTMGYQAPRRNFLRFLEPLAASGAAIVLAEGLHDDVPPLPQHVRDAVTWIGVPYAGMVWQKERLLNLALQRVSDRCEAVAWLDTDIVFANRDWMPLTVEAIAAGKRFVQPFDDFVRLPEIAAPGAGVFAWIGYGYSVVHDPASAGAVWGDHGHTGLAWAADAALLGRTGLYDRWPAGTGDHLMAHAMTGTGAGTCVADSMGAGSAAHLEFLQWAAGWRPQGSRPPEDAAERLGVGYVPGAVVHLWHGDYADRRYGERENELRDLDFDPLTDLTLTDSGAWEVRRNRPDVAQWARTLAAERQEDGRIGATRLD